MVSTSKDYHVGKNFLANSLVTSDLLAKAKKNNSQATHAALQEDHASPCRLQSEA